MSRFMLTGVALAAGLLAAQAQAQTTDTPANPSAQPPAAMVPAAPAPTMAAPAKPAHHTHVSLADQFAAANTTHDGQLTRDQAVAAKWGSVSKHFDAIDKDKKGYVTLADIKAYRGAHHPKPKSSTMPAKAPTPAPAPAAAPATNG
jgi:hypothetical protein